MRIATAALTGLLFAASCSAAALAQSAPGGEASRRTMTARGNATIYGGDVAGAQDRAVGAALLRALERFGGMHLAAHTRIANDQLVRRELQSRTTGFVHGYEVLEAAGTGSIVSVLVRVELGSRPPPPLLRRLQDGRVLVVVNATGPGASSALRILRLELARPFPGARVALPTADLDAEFLDVPGETRRPGVVGATELGRQLGATLVILARVRTELLPATADDVGYDVSPALTFHVAATTGSILVLSARNGEVMAGRIFSERRAADAGDALLAARRSVAQQAASMRSYAASCLTEHLFDQQRTLRVMVKGSASMAARVRRSLEAKRWTEQIRAIESDQGRLTLAIVSRVPAELYVAELRADPTFMVAAFDAATAEVAIELAR